jgi:hypothetical protein
MVRTRNDRTYRASNIPYSLDSSSLVSLLASIEGEGFGPLANICICSLAPSLILGTPSKTARTKTATITFKKVPIPFDDDRTEWTIPIRYLAFQQDIIFDIHFEGFTPLNDVSANEHTVE